MNDRGKLSTLAAVFQTSPPDMLPELIQQLHDQINEHGADFFGRDQAAAHETGISWRPTPRWVTLMPASGFIGTAGTNSAGVRFPSIPVWTPMTPSPFWP